MNRAPSASHAVLSVRPLVYAGELLALAVVYVIVARIGLAMDAVAGFATLVWPPTGVALAALILRGYRLWPAIALGAFVANTLTGAPLLVALGIATGNTLEAVLGTWALRRIPGFRPSLDRLRDALALIVFAAGLATMVSATIGTSSLHIGGIIPGAEYGRAWRAWWLGDVVGALLVAPLLLVWVTSPRVPMRRSRDIEAAVLLAFVVAVCVLVFVRPVSTGLDSFTQAYLIFPPLIWAALRFDQRGAASAAFVVAVLAIIGTAMGDGPFTRSQLQEGLFALQTFMAVTTATFLLLGASIAERRFALRNVEWVSADRDIAHQRLLTVLEQSPVGIGIVDAATGRFLFLNEEAERLMGERPAVVKVTDPHATRWRGFRPDGSEIEPNDLPLARAIRRGETVRDEVVRVVRGDETFVDVAMNAAPVRDADEEVIAAVVIFWDVTAERRAKEELRTAHEAVAAANRAKAEFFAVMSHELRTPLNAIAGHVELLSLGLQGPLTDEQRTSLDRIQRSQRHLLSLIEDVLVFAKLEADQLAVEVRRVAVREIVDGLESLVGPDLTKKEVTLDADACDDGLFVWADPDKLRQILLNLVSNSVKFTPAGGRVTVRAERDDARVRVTVSDTGIGIPAEQAMRVFEPFFQVERGPTRRYPGVGLGLSIARDLARAMGGDVWVQESSERGTTMAVALPAA